MCRYGGFSALLLLGAVGPAAAQVTIEGPERLESGRLGTFSAAGGDFGRAGYFWDVSPNDRADLVEMGPRLVLTAPPGTYRIRLRLVHAVEGGLAVENAVKLLTVGGSAPVVMPSAVSVPALTSAPPAAPSAPLFLPPPPTLAPLALPVPTCSSAPLGFPAAPPVLLGAPAGPARLGVGGTLLERRLERRLEAQEASDGRSRLRGVGVGFEAGRGLRLFIGSP